MYTLTDFSFERSLHITNNNNLVIFKNEKTASHTDLEHESNGMSRYVTGNASLQMTS